MKDVRFFIKKEKLEHWFVFYWSQDAKYQDLVWEKYSNLIVES